MLAVLRSQYKKGAAVGVMITASHNPAEDNGAKIVDPYGEMLEQAWEAHATRLANCPDAEVAAVFEDIARATGTDRSVASHVIVGRDTRASGPALVAALTHGVEAVQGKLTDAGVVTTPQLHFIVRCTNDSSYGVPTVEGYTTKIATAFRTLIAAAPPSPRPTLTLDCANGVGAQHFVAMAAALGDALQVTLVHTGDGQLNHRCGADFVKVQQCAPDGLAVAEGQKCASLDGDADRVVYYTVSDGSFALLDGDRISILAAQFLSSVARAAGVTLNIGVVQTAYANGSSTKFITDTLHVPVACAKTGVKHLHHLAQDYDVGVYFEANGHGTVLFSDNALKTIATATASTPEAATALANLRATVDLINQTVGDAFSDLLLVEVILAHSGQSVKDWLAQFADLPSRQLKVKIANRAVVLTTDAERRCTAPAGLQERIDALAASFPSGRSFARPSGTEDVVRVYAEAATREQADALALEVSRAVYDLAGGVGPRP